MEQKGNTQLSVEAADLVEQGDTFAHMAYSPLILLVIKTTCMKGVPKNLLSPTESIKLISLFMDKR